MEGTPVVAISPIIYSLESSANGLLPLLLSTQSKWPLPTDLQSKNTNNIICRYSHAAEFTHVRLQTWCFRKEDFKENAATVSCTGRGTTKMAAFSSLTQFTRFTGYFTKVSIRLPRIACKDVTNHSLRRLPNTHLERNWKKTSKTQQTTIFVFFWNKLSTSVYGNCCSPKLHC